MCATCGCGEADARLTGLGTVGPGLHTHGHDHSHGDDHDHHGHDGHHSHGDHHDGHHGHDWHDHVHLEQDHELRTHTLELEVAVLAKNDGVAAENRAWLAERRITSLNLMSSPGSGKTTLLERTIAMADRPVSVIEGDQETLFDAERIHRAGAQVVQVNTGAGCHLDAAMVSRALSELRPAPDSILFIENVGNLVCPALFDLGETRKVVIISVTEGDDKPLKYPHMFAAADLVVVNKTDLLPYVEFDMERLTDDARRMNPRVHVLSLSAKTCEGLEAWQRWLTAL